MGGDDDDTRLPPSNPNESSDGNWSIYSLEVPISGEPLCLLRVCNATMYLPYVLCCCTYHTYDTYIGTHIV